jgi:hypothetical protein
VEHEVEGRTKGAGATSAPGRPKALQLSSFWYRTVGNFCLKSPTNKGRGDGRGPGPPSALSSGGAQQVEGDCSSPRSLLARWIEMRLFLTVWAGQLL